MSIRHISPLKSARLAKGLSMAKLGRMAGTSAQQIDRLEKEAGAKDGRKLTKEWAERLAPHLGVAPSHLIFGENAIPLIGESGAGGIVTFFENRGTPPKMVEGYEGAPAESVAIKLNSSISSMFYGWLAYYDKISDRVTASHIGQICVAWLDDGSAVIRQIMSSPEPGCYTLLSMIDPPIYNAKIVKVAKIRNMQPPSD
jgi:transcriptional regulator with XRE-family HTH domain